MKDITIQDCEQLYITFCEYCKTAEQHEYPILILIDFKMQQTIEKIKKDGAITNQSDIRAMFRTVLRITGKDFSEYVEADPRQEGA